MQGNTIRSLTQSIMARIGLKNLAQTCHRVGSMLRAGVDQKKVWLTESERGSEPHKKVSLDIAQRIQEGSTLSDALKAQDRYFPAMVSEMIEVGENTGREWDVFLRLADHYNHMLELRRTFLGAILMPALQLLASLFVVGAFIWLIGMLLPEEHHSAVDVFGIGVGYRGLRNYLLILGFVAIVGAITIKLFVDEKFGNRPFELILRTPVIGECLRLLALSRMAWALALANDAGMSARRTMSLALRATQFGYYKEAIPAVDKEILAGEEMTTALQHTGKFPVEFLDVMGAGELTGQIPESLLRLSDEYRERAELLSQTITKIASFAVWAIVAIIIIIFIFKLAMFYIGMLNDAAAGI